MKLNYKDPEYPTGLNEGVKNNTKEERILLSEIIKGLEDVSNALYVLKNKDIDETLKKFILKLDNIDDLYKEAGKIFSSYYK